MGGCCNRILEIIPRGYTDFSTGVQRGANSLQKKWPNEAIYNSISRNALAGPGVLLENVSLAEG